ncbi:hypothetical protein GJ699_03390 [Duganella sp. FT80W]|uniref:Uncharacterized protein n=1 Tax=Duganella guangzhouensis TaxID=2666084 RepID=A0A6I2KUF5_9BURK|nr:hypothetical protein [Duganella guangzhouensis]MRW89020.1 hypothetical protein [Duganella guangzhouensis]
MRVLLAALFVFGSMLLTVGAIDSAFAHGPWPWWGKFAPAAVMLCALVAGLSLFNRRGAKPRRRVQTMAEHIADLESQGQLVRETYRATRAFGVEEFEDEGSHYFIELADGRVLYLSGQYLYDFEPISDDPELNQSRRFPCTEFEVLRHKDRGYVIDIHCAGQVLEPELIAPAFTQADWQRGVPEDGDIIDGKAYDALKLERTAG